MNNTKNEFDSQYWHFQTTEFDSWAKRMAFSGLYPEEKYCINKYLRDKNLYIMDMGTGGGRIALGLAEIGFSKVYGFDFVPEMIECARNNAELRKVEIKFVVANAQKIPLPDNSIDAAIYWEKLLSFLPNMISRNRAIEDAFRILSPGGFLFCSYNQFLSRRINIFLRHYNNLLNLITRQYVSDRFLPIIRRDGKLSLKSFLIKAPRAYWHYIDEAVWELARTGFQIIEMFSSYGFKRDSFDKYEYLKKGVFYLVAQKPK